MERNAAPRDLQNRRFQQALYRAYYDAHVRSLRSRLVHETAHSQPEHGHPARCQR
jgi:hypothetical protein